MQSIFHACFLLLHFTFGGGTDIDHGDTAGQLGQTLLELFAVVIGGGFLDLAANLVDATLNISGLAVAFHDGGVVLINDDGLGAAEIGELEVFKLQAEVLGNALAAGQDGDVFEHGFAAIAEARGFDCAGVENATELIDDEGCQGFTFHLFGDDEDLFADFGDLFENRQDIFEAADLLFVDEDVGIAHLDFHRLCIGHKVGREVAFIELHTFDHFEGGFDALGFFNGDGSILADFIHGISDDFANGGIPVGGDGCHLFDFFLILDLFGDFGQMLNGCIDGLLDTALDADRVCTAGDMLHTGAEDRLGQNGCGGGTVTGCITGLAGDLADHGCAHVFIGALQFDFLGDGNAILGNRGRAKFFVDNYVATFGAERRADRFGEGLNAGQESLTRFFIK